MPSQVSMTGCKHIQAAVLLSIVFLSDQIGRTCASYRSLKQDSDFVPGPSSSEGVTILASVYYPPPPSEIPTKPELPIKNIPRYNRTEWYTQGPVKPSNIKKSAPSRECMTVGDVLKAIGADKWYDILADTGLKSSVLDDPKVQTTLLVPLDYTFFREIDATPLRNESTMDELVFYAPEIQRPLAGASILKGLWPTDSLGTSMKVPTSNTMDKVTPLYIIVEEDKVLQAQNGNAVNILQGDIAACGPSIIHIVDDIVLPFRFDQKPVDAVSGTQAVKP
mmetsp:Transcript_10032/g.19754  ORF Transcript_10032/g.19754 Transcript_10032/m.19754 type:complete len:278 (-) Transcript_10032:743-1576(-)